MKKTTCAVLSFTMLAACFLVFLPAAGAAAAIVNPNGIFAMLPEIFTFASGAGGWATEVHINADGTFAGVFEDWDMGDSGNGYPNGTKYECYFSGSFMDAVRVSDFEYSLRIAALQAQGTEGEERIIDGARIITAYPYGFDDAGEFRLYLPGMMTKDLPQAYVGWVRWPLSQGSADGSLSPILPFYGLYNVGGEQGFYSDDVTAVSQWSTAPSESSSYIMGTVTVTRSGSVVLRNRASEDGNTILRISAGEACPCVGLDASGWYKVYYNGYIGYVPNSAVTFSAQDTGLGHGRQILGVVEITSNDFVNIRSEPNQHSDWLAGVSPNVALDYIDIAQNGWYCVVLPSGQIGYVSNKLCSPR